MRIKFGQDLEPDMLLDDPLYCGGQSRQIVDVTGISENRPGQRPRLRPRISMMRLVEQIADFGVFEHARVHFVDDVEAVRFECRDGGFDARDRIVAERLCPGTYWGLGTVPQNGRAACRERVVK